MKLLHVALRRLDALAIRLRHRTRIGLRPSGARLCTRLRLVGFGLALVGVAMVGILSPIVLVPDRLYFSRPVFAPTLEGQHVLKVAVLPTAALVVAGSASNLDAGTAPSVDRSRARVHAGIGEHAPPPRLGR